MVRTAAKCFTCHVCSEDALVRKCPSAARPPRSSPRNLHLSPALPPRLTLTALAPPLKAASHSAAPSGYGPHALDGKGATAVDKSNAMPPIGGAQTVLQRRPTASVASVPAPSREQRPCRGCEGHESYTAGVVLVATGGQSDALSPRETRWVAACLTLTLDSLGYRLSATTAWATSGQYSRQ